MLKRFIPIAIAGPLIGLASLAVGTTASAQSDCSVSSYRTQTDPSQTSDQVRCIQQTLNDRGIDSGPVDGWFGPVTHHAVRVFQEANGLTVDGEVGSQTAGALGIWDGSARQVAAASSTPRNTSRHTSGSTGSSGVNWDNVARCESGSDWDAGLRTNHVGTFSGGLMIMKSAWLQYGGGEFAPHAGAATREQQIIVAERIAARVGAARAWECPVG